jgi:transposase
VIDGKGTVLWRGNCAIDPGCDHRRGAGSRPRGCRVGLETGQLSNWLTLNLRRRGIPIICLDARHAKAALSSD